MLAEADRNSHGIEQYRVPEGDALALQDLAVEAMPAFLAADARQIGFDRGDLQVQLDVPGLPVRRLTDFGYSDGVPTEIEH